MDLHVGPDEPPSLYEYYTAGGVKSGLTPISNRFLLNGKPYHLISGAIHYYRVHPAYWRDRLRKLRASGITAVETYVAWNLHEPQRDAFNFGSEVNSHDMTCFLDVVSYLKMAQEEDLFVVLRPGPYICSEWDFGGLPSWLLRDHCMQVRTSYPPFLNRALNFFDHFIPLITKLQFTRGGPIIAVQVENEYGAFGYDDQPRDRLYMQQLAQRLRELGIEEMLLTSDYILGNLDWGAVSGALMTANFQYNPREQFQVLRSIQPDTHLMVTELWTGWFDHWTQENHDCGLSPDGSVVGLANLRAVLTEIVTNIGASINFYMFHGGTNFGFHNGANAQAEFPFYLPDVTSYDYDAPLTEAGDYSAKYEIIAELVKKAHPVDIRCPPRPVESEKIAYSPLTAESFLTLDDLIDQVPEHLVVKSPVLLAMEDLPINNCSGQSYGFIVYRKKVGVHSSSTLKIRNHIRDFAQVLINGHLQTPPITSLDDLANKFGSWCLRDSSFTFGSWRAMPVEGDGSVDVVLDIIVENLGRVNYGKPHHFKQKKGLWEGPVYLDGAHLTNWSIFPLEFKRDWINGLSGWKPCPAPSNGPVAVRFSLAVDKAADSFLDMSSWGKGVVFVNGFNLGRYWSSVGPQRSLYLPGPLLTTDPPNEVIVYEQYSPVSKLVFRDQPILGEIVYLKH